MLDIHMTLFDFKNIDLYVYFLVKLKLSCMPNWLIVYSCNLNSWEVSIKPWGIKMYTRGTGLKVL